MVERTPRQMTVRKAVKLKDGSNSEAKNGKTYVKFRYINYIFMGPPVLNFQFLGKGNSHELWKNRQKV